MGRLNPTGQGESPRYRVEVDASGAQWKYAGNVEGGTGMEMTTKDVLSVIHIVELEQ